MLFLFLFVANIYLMVFYFYFFLISASEDLKELLMTVEGININPLNTLKFSVQAEMPLPQHPYLCLLFSTFPASKNCLAAHHCLPN